MMISTPRSIDDRIAEVATHGDAAWFNNNPDRRIRIRQAVAGEFAENIGQPPVGMRWFVLVLEAQPGARLRQPIALSIGFDISGLDDGALFSLFKQASPVEARDLLSKLRAAKLPGITKPAS